MKELHCSDAGKGEAVLFIHAFPLDGRMWEPQSDLARDVRVVIPDLRGFGASVSGSFPQSLDEHADDLARLLDRLQIAKATLVGLSLGGYVAFRFAERHGARIARLALCDTRASADTPETRRARDQNVALVENEGVGALLDKMLPNLLRKQPAEAVAATVRAIGCSQSKEAVKAALVAMRDRPDSAGMLAKLGIPTAVIVGREDVITPRSESAKMAELVPGSELHVLNDAGHLSNLEAPAAFNAALRTLLRR
jgi:pimeloyl-ACP methyl ester carboxylesterase